MRVSMWSSFFIEMSPEQMAETMAARGWRYSELSDEHAKVLLERGNITETAEKFKSFCDDLGLSFPQGHFYLTINIAHPDPKIRTKLLDDFKSWCELFNILDIQAGVLHPGGAGWPDNSDKQQIMDTILDSLTIIDRYVEGTPTTVCLENMRNLPVGCSVDDLLELTAPFSSDNFGICLDTGHLVLARGECAGFIHKAGAKLKALHIADNMGVNDDHIFPFSGGVVPWKEAMTALKDINYQGLFNFEVPGERCPQPLSFHKLDYALKLGRWMCRDS